MDSQREERIRRYEERGGPMQGHRGVYAHLDPVEPPAGNAYDRWVEVSERVLASTADPEVLEVLRAASAAMAELHDQIAHLERQRSS